VAGGGTVSDLSEHVENYLATRRALGYRLEDDGRLLPDFVSYLHRQGTERVTVDAALAWATQTDTSTQRTANRLAAVRHFASYLQVFEPDTQIPPIDLLPKVATRTAPYLYSPGEIAALMGAAAGLNPPLWAASFTTLIGLMASTGLRTGESWRLDRDDVNIDEGALTVRFSKFNKSRQVPLHATTCSALASYARRRDDLFPNPTSPSFLIDRNGHRLSGSAMSNTFRRLLARTGITAPATRRGPRLHDLRHTFAVTTLLGWHTDGVDVQQRLPVLSTYLGHLNPTTTYWYLEAAPELMAIVAGRVERFWGELA